jgi:hypothetical protein
METPKVIHGYLKVLAFCRGYHGFMSLRQWNKESKPTEIKQNHFSTVHGKRG